MSRMSVKRSFSELPQSQPNCSPFKMMAVSESPRVEKRARHNGVDQFGARTPPRNAAFRPPEATHNIDEAVREATEENSRKRPRLEQQRADGETLFTLDQVRKIVRDSVNLRDRQLREEYDNKLQGLLQEQFDNFTRFNEDYISRMMRKSNHGEEYIS